MRFRQKCGDTVRGKRLPESKRREGRRMAYRLGEETLQWVIFAMVGIIVVALAVVLLTHN